jgi:hypothetical protein
MDVIDLCIGIFFNEDNGKKYLLRDKDISDMGR